MAAERQAEMEAGRSAAAVEVAIAAIRTPQAGHDEQAKNLAPLGRAATDEYGDRRQELVFIGYFRQPQEAQQPQPHEAVGAVEACIRRLLDSCLLTEPEMARYGREQAARNLLA